MLQALTTNSINNTGTITNSGVNAGTGTVTITGGVGANVTAITLNSTTSALTISTTAITVNSGGTTLTNTSGGSALTVSGGVGGVGNLILNNNSALAAGVTLAAINNTGTITNAGTNAGTVTITGIIGTNVTGVTQNSATSTLLLSGANTFTGAATVTAGTLQAGIATALTVANTVGVANGATFDLNGFDLTIAGLTAGSGAVTNTGGTAKTLTLGGSGVYSSGVVIQAPTAANMRLTVALKGSGLQTLSGANTYTGVTTLTSGILNLTGSLADTAVTIAVGGTLMGTGTISNTTAAITVNGTLAPGDAATATSLHTGAVTFSNGSTFRVYLGGNGNSLLALDQGTPTLIFTTTTNIDVIQNGAAPGAGAYTVASWTTGPTNTNAAQRAMPPGLLLTGPTTSGSNTQVTVSATVPTTRFWTGTASANWNAVGNWDGGASIPNPNDNIVFDDTNFTGVNQPNLNAASVTVGALTFSCTKVVTISRSSTYVLTIDGNVTVNPATAQSITISAPVVLGAPQTWSIDANANGSSLAVSGILSGGSTNALTVIGGSSTSTLTLSGVNTFTGGLTIKSGRIMAITSASALGAGAVTLGDSAGGSNAASLLIGTTGLTYSNPLVLAANTTGTLTIGNTSNIASTIFSGGVTGANNLTVNNTSTGASTITFSTVRVNNNGTITNIGSSTGATTLSGGVGANVTGITENSTSSALTVSGLLTVNNGGTTLTNSSGTVLLTVSGGVGGTGNLILNNNSATANGITLSTTSVNPVGMITNSGSGTGSTLISAPMGATVTNVTQNSVNSSLTLNGTNTPFGGTTTLAAGTLKLGSATALGGNGSTTGVGGALSIAAGTTLDASAVTTLTTVNAQNWNGNFTFGGSFTLSTGTGAITLGAAAIQVSNSGANTLTVAGGVTGVCNLTLNANGAGGFTFSTNRVNNTGTITNSGSGAGTTTLSGGVGANVSAVTENSITSALTISTTALTVNGGGTTLTNSSGTHLLTVSGGVVGTGNLILNNNSATANGITLSTTSVNPAGQVTNTGNGTGGVTISAIIGSNVSGVTQNSATSALTLSGTNTFAGILSVQAGILGTATVNNASASGPLGSSANAVFLGNSGGVSGTLEYTGATASSTKTFTLAAGGTGVFQVNAGGATLTLSGAIGGAGGLTKTGAGALTLSGANNYGGATTLSAGQLNLNSTTAIGSGTFIISGANTIIDNTSAGALTLANNNVQNWNADFTFTGTKNLNLGAGAVILSGNRQVTVTGGELTADGAIGDGGGALALTKAGTGTLALGGNNTYTGTTTVNAGALLVNGSTTAGSTVTVNSGGTLGGAGTCAGTVTVANGATLNPGLSAASTGTLITGNAAFDAGSTFAVDFVETQCDQLNVPGGAGTISLGNGNCTLSAAFGGVYSPQPNDTFTLIRTPENAGGVSGTFSGLANGATVMVSGYSFTISYTGNSVILTRGAATEDFTFGTLVSLSDRPRQLCVDSQGNLFVTCEEHVIYKVTPQGVSSVFAGVSGAGAGNTDGNGAAARFNTPNGIVIDSADNLYVADVSNNSIRKITPAADVTTFAAGFNAPQGVAVDSAGNLYVADTTNHKICKVTPAQVVTTIAGTGASAWVDGAGGVAQFSSPRGIVVDSGGNVYVGDTGNNRIRKLTTADGGATWTVATVAGQTASGWVDGPGAAAKFYTIASLAVDGNDNVIVGSKDSTGIYGVVRKVTPAGVVTTIGGSGSTGNKDGTGRSAQFFGPQGVAFDSQDVATQNLYVAAFWNQRICKGVPAGRPMLLAVEPFVDSIAGGATVTLRGVNLHEASAVAFGANAATIILSNPQELVVTVPAHAAGNVDITVTTSGGSAINRNAFTYIDAPTILSVSPSTGVLQGGYTVTITGVNLSDATSVTFGGAAATILSNTGTLITVMAPAHAAGIVDVDVTTPAGTVTSAGAFTYGAYYTFTTMAGKTGVRGSTDAAWGPDARFEYPKVLAVDGNGNVFVGDTYNHTIRKITSAGTVTTLAGVGGAVGSSNGTGAAARFNAPQGIAVDSSGNIYVAEPGEAANAHTIRKITPAGVVTTLAGTYGATGSSDGIGAAARFNNPQGLGIDNGGNILYVADRSNHTIRKIIIATAEVSTFAGTAGVSGSTDGTGAAARFNAPSGVAVDSSGNLYVTDSTNQTLRKITPAAEVTTLAGLAGSPGSADGTGAAARFADPSDVAVDSAGDLYVTDFGNATIRKVTALGVVTTLSGTDFTYAYADGIPFSGPTGIAVDSGGNLYVVDYYRSTIRKGALWPKPFIAGLRPVEGSTDGATLVTLAGGNLSGASTVTFAGTAAAIASGTDTEVAVTTPAHAAGAVDVALTTANGTATNLGAFTYQTAPAVISLSPPSGVPAGGTVVAITGPNLSGATSVTFGGVAAAILSNSASEIVVANPAHAAGAVDVAVTVAAGTATKTGAFTYTTLSYIFTTLAGTASSPGSTDAQGNLARFDRPSRVAVDASGNVYIADQWNHTIRKINSAGGVSTLAGLAGFAGRADGTGAAARFNSPAGITVDGGGNLYVTDALNHTIRKLTPAGVVTTLAGAAGASGYAEGAGAVARFNSPQGLAFYGGNLYVADFSNHRIRKVALADGTASLWAGSGTAGFVNAVGALASFSSPYDVAVDSGGNVYVADFGNHKIRRIDPTQTVTTLAGSGAGNADGIGGAAQFDEPITVAVDAGGNIFEMDNTYATVRKITTPGAVVTTLAGSSVGAVDGVGSEVQFGRCRGIAVDAAGFLYVCDTTNYTIRKGSSGLPIVCTVAPVSGSNSGGTTVTITGAALKDASAVTFGGVAVAIVSNTDGKFRTPDIHPLQNVRFLPFKSLSGHYRTGVIGNQEK